MKQAVKTPILNALYARPGSERDTRTIASLLANTGMAAPTIEHLRFKPGTSAVARIVDAARKNSDAANQPWWFAAYSPSETEKAGKLLRRADETGFPMFTALLPDDPRTSVFCGPIGLDRMLFKALEEVRAVDSRGQVAGTVLSYNPWRRLVYRRTGADGSSSVVRVWAEPPATTPLLSALHRLGAPVLPVIGKTEHSVEQPWITGGDFTQRLSSDPTAGTTLLPAVARAVARLHSIDPADLASAISDGPAPGVSGSPGHSGAVGITEPTGEMPSVPGVDPAAALRSAANGLTCFLANLRAEFEAVADHVLRSIAEHPSKNVLSHGDLSADQVVLDENGAPVLIDFDRLKVAPAAYDLGDFTAVELLSGRHPSTAAALAEAYRQAPGAGTVSDRAVHAWTAFHILLRVSEAFRNLDPDCVIQAQQRIELARAVLRGEMG